jgi:5-(carboxyamino)imidazole ribonucleotide mutase
MPGGVPVATVALDGGKNAGILAAQMVGAFDQNVSENIADYMEGLKAKVMESVDEIASKGYKNV